VSTHIGVHIHIRVIGVKLWACQAWDGALPWARDNWGSGDAHACRVTSCHGVLRGNVARSRRHRCSCWKSSTGRT
jgi:hypothetical protein